MIDVMENNSFLSGTQKEVIASFTKLVINNLKDATITKYVWNSGEKSTTIEIEYTDKDGKSNRITFHTSKEDLKSKQHIQFENVQY